MKRMQAAQRARERETHLAPATSASAETHQTEAGTVILAMLCTCLSLLCDPRTSTHLRAVSEVRPSQGELTKCTQPAIGTDGMCWRRQQCAHSQRTVRAPRLGHQAMLCTPLSP